MKVCYCVLVHNDPKILKKLIYSLDYPGFDFVIHVDLKTNIEDYHFDQYELKYSRLVVLDNRCRVFWGDISIVEATLNMYRKGLSIDHYDRFVTLSGNDYPIMSNQEISDLFENNSEEYIYGNPIFKNHYFKVEKYYFFKHSRITRKLMHIVASAILPPKSRYVTINDKQCGIYFSPQWHALTENCVKYILKTIDDNPQIMKYFRYSFAPDELLIPTIIFNSNFQTKDPGFEISVETHYNQKNATHYLNYDGPIEVFDERKYKEICKSNKIFLRKVRSGKSEKLIQLLEKKRNDSKSE